MQVYYPPEYVTVKNTSIFLAGTIDNGESHNWQADVVASLGEFDISIFNPRRVVWDPALKQDISNDKFREQVEWELDYIEHCDHVIMNFLPDSKSPITLLELGLIAGSNPEKLLVCCPASYWRLGNVQVVCEFYGVKLYDTLDELVIHTAAKLNS